MRLGVHVAIGKGLCWAAAEAVRLRCECMQIFLGNPRAWARGADYAEQDVAALRETLQRRRIWPLIGHASYLVNLASPDPRLWRKSLDSAAADIRRAIALGTDRFVLHAGHHGGAGEREGARLVARGVRELAGAAGGALTVLVENTSGAGTSVGWRLEGAAEILAHAGDMPNLGFCLDTCHAHVAGYALNDAESANETVERLDRTIGLTRVGAVHLNDARYSAGSHRDAHAHIGEGTIGSAGFRALLAHPGLAQVPGIIETPKEGNADARNLRRLRRLRAEALKT